MYLMVTEGLVCDLEGDKDDEHSECLFLRIMVSSSPQVHRIAYYMFPLWLVVSKLLRKSWPAE